jgi:putative glycosyl hydrolase-like family 15 (GHL15) protein
MRLLAALLSASFVATLAIAAALAQATGSPRPRATPPQPSVGSYRVCSGCASKGRLSKYRYVLLNAGDYKRIRRLKAANPGIKVFVYKDMASTRSWSCGGLVAGGVDYCWAKQRHPEWFTHQVGAPFEWSRYPSHWQMNVGAPAYQNAWAANVVSELRRRGWDGVIIDNANMDPSRYRPFPYDEYPTRQSYQDATRSFLASVGPKIRRAGFLVIPNIQHSPVYLTKALWSDWIQFTSGATLEHYTRWSTGDSYIGDSAWEWSGQELLKLTQNAGKIFIGAFAGAMTDTRAMRYARASFLLDWNGGASALAFDPGATNPWSAEWTIDIGRPLGQRYPVGPAWRRDYSGGTVVANPSSTASASISLETSYVLPDGSKVDAIDLPPMTGTILRSASQSRGRRSSG